MRSAGGRDWLLTVQLLGIRGVRWRYKESVDKRKGQKLC